MIKYNKDGSLDKLSLNAYEKGAMRRAKMHRGFGRRANILSLQRHRTFWWGFLFVVWIIIFPISVTSGCFSHLPAQQSISCQITQ